jgi:N-hydroxyarylamine O-acetyltransferase
MIPLEEILEALELPRSEPGIGYLQALFARFNERVPFETASKIVRNAEVSDPAEKPRRPDLFWAENLNSGAGGTCFARVAAFDALLGGLGFARRIALGQVQSPFDHASLLVTLEGEEWICDVGFPLPDLLRCAGGETESALGALRVTPQSLGWRIELLGGVPEGPRELEVFAATVPREALDQRWQETYRPESRFLTAVSLRREKQARTVSFAQGEIRVDDLHSRTRIPLPAPRAPLLQEQFGIARDLLERAFGLAGDPDSTIPSSEVCVYLEVEHPAEVAFEAIAALPGYRALMEGVARVKEQDVQGGAWRLRLSPPAAAGEEGSREGDIEEEVAVDGPARALRVVRGSRESFYQVLLRGKKTFLVRRLVLPGPRLDLLRNDSLRGRFAGTLAVDLLAWARLLGR